MREKSRLWISASVRPRQSGLCAEPYELKRPQAIPNFLLLDAGDEPVTLDLVPPDDAERARCARERAQTGGWMWCTDRETPPLPAAVRREAGARQAPAEPPDRGHTGAAAVA